MLFNTIRILNFGILIFHLVSPATFEFKASTDGASPGKGNQEFSNTEQNQLLKKQPQASHQMVISKKIEYSVSRQIPWSQNEKSPMPSKGKHGAYQRYKIIFILRCYQEIVDINICGWLYFYTY